MGIFFITKRTSGDFKFSFAARRGKIVFTSIAYKQKADCEALIEVLSQDISRFTLTKVRNAGGKYFFRISKDGFVLANSRKYTTELLLAKGIDQVYKYIASSETLDFSDNDFVFPDDNLGLTAGNEVDEIAPTAVALE